jgi:hypothetical protein
LEKMRRLAFLLFGAAVLLLSAGMVALAQGGYELPWWTVDGGGTSALAGAGYTLAGTAGQPDAGGLIGGGYTLSGGFWRGGAAPASPYAIYVPLVKR